MQCGDCRGGAFAAAPRLTMEEAVRAAEDLIARARMCFMPENLEFLRAGGRVSNVAFLGAKLLNLHPVIEILDGKLVATKKYRGKMKKVAVQMRRNIIWNGTACGLSGWSAFRMRCGRRWRKRRRRLASRKPDGFRRAA